MDELDVAICRFPIYNSRMPYSELAGALDITVQAAHRRVRELVSSGIIGRRQAVRLPGLGGHHGVGPGL